MLLLQACVEGLPLHCGPEDIAAAETQGRAAAAPALVKFSIDRQKKDCHTPANNSDVIALMTGALRVLVATWLDDSLVGVDLQLRHRGE